MTTMDFTFSKIFRVRIEKNRTERTYYVDGKNKTIVINYIDIIYVNSNGIEKVVI